MIPANAKKAIAALPLLMLAALSHAEDDVSRCASIQDRDQRLACYDGLSAGETGTVETLPYLSRAWRLGPNDAGVRRIADITTYRPNYILGRWTNSPNVRPRSPTAGRSNLEDLNRDELKLQASFKTELISRQAFERIGVTPALNHLGIDSTRLWFAYTQKISWQAFNHGQSRPIRDANYEPEAILTLGTGNQGDGFKLINLGFSHESNGLDPGEHRGWTREYVQGGWEWGRLSVLARAWHVLYESDDDNPNIRRFMGNGDVVARYQSAGGYVTSALLRRNLGTQRGFLQLDWATPVLRALGNLKFHTQFSSGYGETLIDYNHRQWTAGIGVSFGD